MSYDPILSGRIARERYNDYLREAAQGRLIARAKQRRSSLARRAARPLGHALLRLGAGLLRYGQAEQPALTVPYRSSVGSIEMN